MEEGLYFQGQSGIIKQRKLHITGVIRVLIVNAINLTILPVRGRQEDMIQQQAR